MPKDKASLEEAIKSAAELADLAPEQYRQSTYTAILLNILLSSQEGSSRLAKPSQMGQIQTDSSGQEKMTKAQVADLEYDWSSTNVPELSGCVQYLKVIDIAKRDLGIDGLSPQDISQVLKEKFRIIRSENTVGMGLMNYVGKYVNRKKSGVAFIYSITKGGSEYIANEESKLQQ